MVYTPSGETLIVHSFTGIFEYVSEIEQFRVIQNEINGIIIEYIPGDGFESTVLEKVEKAIRSNLKDEDFKIEFKEVNHIPNTPSGKPQIIQNNLSNKDKG